MRGDKLETVSRGTLHARQIEYKIAVDVRGVYVLSPEVTSFSLKLFAKMKNFDKKSQF